MTRQEAIEYLDGMKIVIPICNELKELTDERNTAIDMAIEALSAEEAVWKEYEAEFTNLPDIPRYYYEKVVGKMAHEINMLKEQLESADAVSRKDIIGYIDRVTHSGLGRNKALEYIRKYVERTESADTVIVHTEKGEKNEKRRSGTNPERSN